MNFVGGAEPVKEVDERNTSLNCRQMRYSAQVHNLLRVGLTQHGETGLTAGIHVGMIAKDIQCLRCHRTGRNMKHSGQQLAGDLIHIGDHQQQALGSGVRGCQGTGG